MTPSRDEATAQLERVLASDLFATASRLSRFLRFVAERSLAGESERLKEYVIGVEVFDRDERYDPRVDSIVRVEAGRLRTKLEQYYNGPGRDDGIVIRIQKGTYAPSFERRAAGTAPVQADESQANALPLAAHERRAADVPHPSSYERPSDVTHPPSHERRVMDSPHPPGHQRVVEDLPHPSGRSPQMPAHERQVGEASPAQISVDARRSSRRKLYFAAAAVVVLGIAAALAVTRLWLPTPPADAVAVLPFEPSTSSPDGRLMAARLTESVTAELVRTGRFSVVPSREARENGSEGSVQSIARRLHASWLLEARVMDNAGAVRVEARMMNAARNRKLWVDSFDGTAQDLDDLSRRIGAAAARALEEHQAAGERS